MWAGCNHTYAGADRINMVINVIINTAVGTSTNMITSIRIAAVWVRAQIKI
jgi:hypothetical protein